MFHALRYSTWLRTEKLQCTTTVLYVMLLNCIAYSLPGFFNDGDTMKLCSREPRQARFERIRGDGGFKIKIDDQFDIQLYAPKHMYRISLSAVLEHTLLEAYLVAVYKNYSNENVTAGKFHVADGGQMGFHSACSHVVTTVGSLPKSEAHVMWTAPDFGAGCVEFRATVVASSDVWYKDDGGLTKVVCEKPVREESSEAKGMFHVADCCACGTAKYQLTFQSLWSRSFHDFPNVNTSELHWSPLVGSSHGKHYTMWRFGSLASHGVSDVCQFGDTRALEDDIRHQSSNIRTVIKTSGIQWTLEHGLLQQRWAHFSVNHNHHLLSVLSRLSPSPDWCVGISALDLCLANCSWLAGTTIRLFAWDAGIVDGDFYTSEKRPSDPVQPISRLPGHLYNKLHEPFYRSTVAEPVALLRLHRFDPKPDDDASCNRIRAKKQDADRVKSHVEVVPQAEVDHQTRNLCTVGPWSPWSLCSTSCGSGVRTRSRTAVETDFCINVARTQSVQCVVTDCEPHCHLSDWSEWSACSDGFLLCSSHDRNVGTCKRRRTRFFQTPEAERFCNETVEEEEPCRTSTVGVLEAFDADVMSKCFSPPDAGPCWRNVRRWYYDPASSTCQTFLYGGCRGNANRYTSAEDCIQACKVHDEPLPIIITSTNTTSDNENSRAGLFTSTAAPEYDYSTRTTQGHGIWNEQDSVVDCKMSPWSAWSSCSVTCGRRGVRTRSRTVRQPPSGGGRKCPRRKQRRRRCSMPPCLESSECQYSHWSSWSPCARSCGTDSVQERIQRPLGTTRRSSCTLNLQRRLCTLPQCF